MHAFELWCWRRLLRLHYIARRSNQSILKEINPEYSLEELMLKLNLQYFDRLRADSLEKTLMLGNIEDRRKRGQQRMRWLDVITDSMDTSLSKLRQIVKDREAWQAAINGDAKIWTWLSNCTTITTMYVWGCMSVCECMWMCVFKMYWLAVSFTPRVFLLWQLRSLVSWPWLVLSPWALTQDIECSVAQLCLTLCDPWTAAHQAPLSVGFSGQQYWSGLPCPPPGDLPTQGLNLCLLFLLQWQDSLTSSSHVGSPKEQIILWDAWPSGQEGSLYSEFSVNYLLSLFFRLFWYLFIRRLPSLHLHS